MPSCPTCPTRSTTATFSSPHADGSACIASGSTSQACWPVKSSASRKSTRAFGSPASCTTISDTSTWSRKPCNLSTTRSARRCHPCLRYDLSPMCPGWTGRKVVPRKGFEPPTPALRTKTTGPTSAFSRAISRGADVICSVLVPPNPGRPLKPKPPDPEKQRPSFAGAVAGSKSTTSSTKIEQQKNTKARRPDREELVRRLLRVTAGTVTIGYIDGERPQFTPTDVDGVVLGVFGSVRD